MTQFKIKDSPELGILLENCRDPLGRPTLLITTKPAMGIMSSNALNRDFFKHIKHVELREKAGIASFY